MKKLLAAILLATSLTSQAVETRQLTVICGSHEEMASTLSNYKELPYIVGLNKDLNMVYSLWVNIETGTTSWVVKLVESKEFCMMGIGTEIIIPPSSPLKDIPVGEKVIFK